MNLCTTPQFMQQSYGSVVLADGRLADLIRRVATFGMVLMKLDLRQVFFFLHSRFQKRCQFTSYIIV